MFEMTDGNQQGAVIKVIGVGGGGGNAVEHMISEGVEGVEFICANTDVQALQKSRANTFQLGEELTKGLGAGADPEVGRMAAQENKERIYEVIQGADMLFITAGMGGGTGTGAAPVFAEVAKELGILTVAVVTKPFVFEGRRRMNAAEGGIKALRENVDSLITIPNNKLLSVLGKSVSLLSAFKSANAVLQGAVQGIAELITRPGLINVDFADVRTVMSQRGMAMMGTGEASGEDRAREAAEAAISCPFLEDIDLSGAGGVLVNITAGSDMAIGEFEVVGDTIRTVTSEDATVVVGTVVDPDMDGMRVTVVVTGLENTLGESSATVTSRSNVDSQRRSDGTIDYNRLDRPTLLRQQTDQHTAPAAPAPTDPHEVAEDTTSEQEDEDLEDAETTETDDAHDKVETEAPSNTVPNRPLPQVPTTDKEIAYLDIPAFLRRQEKKKEAVE